jgi:hypothetical protein
MPIYATCTDSDWQVEADDRADAHGASLNHWDAAHAPEWCFYCQPTGPSYKRNDHDDCTHLAVTEGWLDQVDPDEVTR